MIREAPPHPSSHKIGGEKKKNQKSKKKKSTIKIKSKPLPGYDELYMYLIN
jgi:hypothetical protein